MSALSNYVEKLPSEAKQVACQSRLLLIGGVDRLCFSGISYISRITFSGRPFCISGKGTANQTFFLSTHLLSVHGKVYWESNFPPVDASDLVSYLVRQISRSAHAVLFSSWEFIFKRTSFLRMIFCVVTCTVHRVSGADEDFTVVQESLYHQTLLHAQLRKTRGDGC